MPRWYITEHAVEQFCMRIDPRVTGDEARTLLEKGVQQSARLKGNTYGGQSRYLLQSPKCIAIVKHDAGTHVVVTVLNVTGDQGRKWILSNEPAARLPDWKPEHHPDWQDLRVETKAALAMMLLRVAAKRDAKAPIEAWVKVA